MAFGTTTPAAPPDPAEPNPLWLDLLHLIPAEGVGRSELLRAVRRPADEVSTALSKLAAAGHAHSRTATTSGRPAERWFPGAFGAGSTDSAPPSATGVWVVQPDDPAVTPAEVRQEVSLRAEGAVAPSFPPQPAVEEVLTQPGPTTFGLTDSAMAGVPAAGSDPTKPPDITAEQFLAELSAMM